MTADEVLALGRLLDGTGIGLLELTRDGETIRLRRHADAAPASSATVTVTAPSVGVFRTAHPMQEAPLARPGRAVRSGEVVGLIEIGALLLHVAAPGDGVVLDVLAEDGTVVGYGAPLLRLAGGAE